jgi:XapX domain-containing protein
MIPIQQYALALLVGVIIGSIFTALHLSIPVPDKIEGVLAVFGIFLGMILVKHFMS